MTAIKSKAYSPNLRPKKPATVKEIYRDEPETQSAAEQRITTSIKMTASLREAVKTYAFFHHTTMGDVMEEALRQWLKEHEK
ncbi:hypothetical protein [Bifidobacterium xylocopae]|uniref:Uncharacterized protein n=1 Tax=Bifidobacterium xylocopae TaxID=2493119 RepID=A0A366KAK0_9BIFI|nr:hypothetical protein [Bifidobacterium xylocopae]RBP98756.1 hypothetical protein CRD59_07410 [Bifidobacterium xylocopae]